MFTFMRLRKHSLILIISALVITSMACGMLSDVFQSQPEDAPMFVDEAIFPDGEVEFLHEMIPFGTIDANDRRHMIRWRFYLSSESIDDAGDFYTAYLSDWEVKKDMEAYGHRHLMLSSDHPLSWIFTQAEFAERLSQADQLTPGLIELEVAHSPAHHGISRSSYDPDRLPDGTIIILVDYLYQDLKETPTAVMETPSTQETPPTSDLGQACQVATSGSLCTNPYFPPIEGLTLVYEIDGHRRQTRRISQVETGVQEPGEPPKDSFVLTLTGGGIDADMEYYCTEEGLVGGDIGRMMVSALEGQDIEGGEITFESMSFEGVMLPNQISPGDTWDAFVEVVLGAPDGVQLITTNNATYHFEGYQTMTVPAGTFETQKILSDMLVEVGALFPNGHFMPLTTTQIHTVFYYAECLGMVMSESDMDTVLVDVIMP